MTGIGIALLVYFEIADWKILSLLVLIGFCLSFICKYVELPFFNFMLRIFERKKDVRHFPGKGMIFFLASAAIVTILFPREIATASIMILGLGDAFGPLVGQFGRIRHPLNQKKVIEGTLAGIFAATFGALFFVPWWHALIASAIAMTFETMEIEINKRIIDDNLVVPLIAGLTLLLLSNI